MTGIPAESNEEELLAEEAREGAAVAFAEPQPCTSKPSAEPVPGLAPERTRRGRAGARGRSPLLEAEGVMPEVLTRTGRLREEEVQPMAVCEGVGRSWADPVLAILFPRGCAELTARRKGCGSASVASGGDDAAVLPACDSAPAQCSSLVNAGSLAVTGKLGTLRVRLGSLLLLPSLSNDSSSRASSSSSSAFAAGSCARRRARSESSAWRQGHCSVRVTAEGGEGVGSASLNASRSAETVRVPGAIGDSDPLLEEDANGSRGSAVKRRGGETGPIGEESAVAKEGLLEVWPDRTSSYLSSKSVVPPRLSSISRSLARSLPLSDRRFCRGASVGRTGSLLCCSISAALEVKAGSPPAKSVAALVDPRGRSEAGAAWEACGLALQVAREVPLELLLSIPAACAGAREEVVALSSRCDRASEEGAVVA